MKERQTYNRGAQPLASAEIDYGAAVGVGILLRSDPSRGLAISFPNSHNFSTVR